MALVPAGTIVTIAVGGYKLVVQPIDNWSGSPFGTQIAQALGTRLHVYTLNINGGDSAADIITSITGNVYAYTLTAQVSSDVAEDPEDMRSAFVAAVFAAAGLSPDTSSVTAINQSATGQPTQALPTSPLKDIFDAFMLLLKTVPTLTTAVLIGGVVLIFVIVSSERKTIVKGLV